MLPNQSGDVDSGRQARRLLPGCGRPARWLAVIACTLFPSLPTVVADDFYWLGVCLDDRWYTVCTRGYCPPPADTLELKTNNWGRTSCLVDPAFPGNADKVFVGNASVTLDQNATIFEFGLGGGTLNIAGGVTLSLNGWLLLNGGLISLE